MREDGGFRGKDQGSDGSSSIGSGTKGVDCFKYHSGSPLQTSRLEAMLMPMA